MSPLRKIWDVTTSIISILAIGLVIVVAVVPMVIGGSYRIVATGSMEPDISPGDIVVMKPPSPEEVKEGEIVTFLPYENNPTTITHRVISENEDGTYTTRGDANGADDKPIKYEQIRGIVMYSVPYVGLAVAPIRNLLIGNAGMGVLAIVGGAFVLYGVFLIVRGLLPQKKEQKDTDNAQTI